MSKNSSPALVEGLNRVEEATDKAFKNCCEGFVLAVMTTAEAEESHVMTSFNGAEGDIEQGLEKVLGTLLSDPDMKAMVQRAFLRALHASRCTCPECTARRADEQASQPTTH